MNKSILFSLISLFFFNFSCNNKTNQIDIDKEIEIWKKELINKNILGTTCNYTDPMSLEAIKWQKENSSCDDGFPPNKNVITVSEDIDHDNQKDLIMYFVADRCNPHNGNVPTFARIVNSNGKKEDLMKAIRSAILEAYVSKMQQDTLLKKIDPSMYFKESVTFEFKDKKAFGQFNLWTNESAHYSSYINGKYEYNIRNREIKIDISVN